jgi:phosphoglycolate phosphatase
MYRLLVFDLDGTLVDSLGDLVAAVNDLVSRYGGRELSPLEVARMVGEGAGVLVGRAIASSGAAVEPREALPLFLDIYDRLLPGTTRPYPGIPEVLDGVDPSVPLAVLTNKPTDATRKILDELGLAPRFRHVIGGDGPHRRKPNPDGLLHLASTAGSGPATTLLVGDSHVDVETAHAAGTRVCVARYGFGQASFRHEALRGDEFFVDRPQDLGGLPGWPARAGRPR